MQWIQLPFIDGETTSFKLFNLAFYKTVKSYNEGLQVQLFEDDDETNVIADVKFETIISQLQGSFSNWKLMPFPKEERRLINLDFYKRAEITEAGAKLWQLDEGKNIETTSEYAALARQLQKFIGGHDGLGNRIDGAAE